MLFKWLNNRKKQRKINNDKKLFSNGLSWAMQSYFIFNHPKDYIESQIDVTDYNLFDEGIEFAITKFDYVDDLEERISILKKQINTKNNKLQNIKFVLNNITYTNISQCNNCLNNIRNIIDR